MGGDFVKGEWEMGNADLAVFKEVLESVGVLNWLASTLGVTRDEAVEFANLNDLEGLCDFFVQAERRSAE
jgi:hypothetical protein